MSYLSTCAACAFTSWALPAFAQPATNPVKPEVPRLTINLAPFFGMTFGTQCHQLGSDTASCPIAVGIAGLRLAPRWRALNDKLGLGFSMGLAWTGPSQSLSSTTWYDGQLGVRYYFGQAGPFQSWLDVTGGAMLAVDRLPTFQADTGASILRHSTSDWAPAASLALGYDAEFVSSFGLAPELRVSYFGLSHHVGILEYNPQTVVTLGLGLVGFGFHH